MANPKTYILLLFMLWTGGLVVTGELRAQNTEQITFERLTIPGTIRSAQVLDILQDKSGMIWVAGSELYRYDGLNFTSYRDIEQLDNALSSRDINCLFYDSARNRILIATRNQGMIAYEYSTDKLRALPGKQKAILNQICQTSDGRIWTLSRTQGMFSFDGDTLVKIPVKGLKETQLSAIASHNNTLLIAAHAKIFTVDNGVVSDTIRLSDFQTNLPKYTRISYLYIDRSSKLWIGTEKNGLFVYDLNLKKYVRHFDPTRAPFFSRINKVYEDHEGLIWILTKANGLAVFDPATEKLNHYMSNPLEGNSISGDNCFSILQDRNGIMWVGAIGDLNKYDRLKIRIEHIRNNPLRKLSITDNMVRGVHEDKTGKIWIGTDGGFVNIIDRKKGVVEKIRIRIPGDTVNYVAVYFMELDDRTMLIGSSLGMLQCDMRTRKITPYKPLWDLTRGTMVRQILKDDDDLYFISGGAFWTFNLKTGEHYSHSKFGSDTAVSVTVMSIDSKKRLWLGVRGGISFIHPETKKFKYVPFEKKGAPPNENQIMVLSLQEQGDKLYAGTFNNGFWRMDISKPGEVAIEENFTESNGLPSNTVYSSLYDGKGNLWLSTNNGIARFNIKSEGLIHFTVTEGLQGEEFNRLAYFRNTSGELIFGGINGINIFHPDELQAAKDKFIPVISGFDASNPVYGKALVRTSLPSVSPVSLTNDQNFVTFHFFVPNYRDPKRFRTFYKLEPFDSDWKEAVHQNEAVYPNLKSGNYIFSVKTRGIDGQEEFATLGLHIALPIWKTWWFILLTVLVIAFFILTILRSYVRRAQYDKIRLEQLLQIRTQEIERSREELMALNQKKDLIFSILSHDLRSPLTTLKGFLGILIDSVDYLSKEDVKRHAMSIRNSVTNSLDLIDNTLFWSLSQMGNIQYSPTAFALRPMLVKIFDLYHLTAEKKKIELVLNCEEDIMLHADENMIYVTLRNLVSNAIKFTPEGKAVNIRCDLHDTTVDVKVIDEGVGMSPEYLRKVLSLDQPMLKKGTSNEKGTGLGLLLCKNFLEMNKGTLNIDSTENSGTTFTITLPLAAVTA